MAASQDSTNMENGKSRIQQMEKDVEAVTEIMVDNFNKIKENKENLNHLEDRSEKVLESGKCFEKTTSKLKEQYKPKNKTKIILIVVGVVVAIVVLGIIIWAFV